MSAQPNPMRQPDRMTIDSPMYYEDVAIRALMGVLVRKLPLGQQNCVGAVLVLSHKFVEDQIRVVVKMRTCSVGA